MTCYAVWGPRYNLLFTEDITTPGTVGLLPGHRMVPTRLSSLSDKLAALLTNTEEDGRSQGREQLRPESEMEDDEESLDTEDCKEDRKSKDEGIDKSETVNEKRKEGFVDCFPILSTLPPIQPKVAPPTPPSYLLSTPPALGDIHPFAPLTVHDPARSQLMIIIVPADQSVILHKQVQQR